MCETVMAGEVGSEDGDGIKWSGGGARNDNHIPLKEPIGLMSRKVVRNQFAGARGRGAEDALMHRLKRRVVMVDKFPQVVKTKETTKREGMEKEVVMGG